MDIVISGRNLPGRTFRNAGVPIHNVHVGLQVRNEPRDLVAADAGSAVWQVMVDVVDSDGAFDFRGPAVHGARGSRFVYLTWGDVGSNGSFAMFRRAKLMLDPIGADLIRIALAERRPLAAAVDLTDAYGGPRCGRVEAPAIAWTVG